MHITIEVLLPSMIQNQDITKFTQSTLSTFYELFKRDDEHTCLTTTSNLVPKLRYRI